MVVIQHNNGRLYFYCPAGGIWGFLLGDAIPRFLMNHFNIHITESISQKSLFAGSIIGVAIGLFLSYLVRDRMIEYRRTHNTKQYAYKIIMEILIMLIVIAIGVICLIDGYTKYHDFLYPKE